MIKNDIWITEKANQGMIQPFHPELVRRVNDTPVISYGLSSYGYDLRLSASDFRIFRHIPGTVVDPKCFSSENLEAAKLHKDDSGDFFILITSQSLTKDLAIATRCCCPPESSFGSL